ncbi:MAG: DUF6054 family protein [Ancrocorticia sp.]
MAQTGTRIRGDFGRFISYIRDEIIDGSASASLEEEIVYNVGDVQVALLVFERYSLVGSNRVSLSVMVTGQGTDLVVNAVTSGGSEAFLFKINTLGEEAFLDKFNEAVAQFR